MYNDINMVNEPEEILNKDKLENILMHQGYTEKDYSRGNIKQTVSNWQKKLRKQNEYIIAIKKLEKSIEVLKKQPEMLGTSFDHFSIEELEENGAHLEKIADEVSRWVRDKDGIEELEINMGDLYDTAVLESEEMFYVTQNPNSIINSLKKRPTIIKVGEKILGACKEYYEKTKEKCIDIARHEKTKKYVLIGGGALICGYGVLYTGIHAYQAYQQQQQQIQEAKAKRELFTENERKNMYTSMQQVTKNTQEELYKSIKKKLHAINANKNGKEVLESVRSEQYELVNTYMKTFYKNGKRFTEAIERENAVARLNLAMDVERLLNSYLDKDNEQYTYENVYKGVQQMLETEHKTMTIAKANKELYDMFFTKLMEYKEEDMKEICKLSRGSIKYLGKVWSRYFKGKKSELSKKRYHAAEALYYYGKAHVEYNNKNEKAVMDYITAGTSFAKGRDLLGEKSNSEYTSWPIHKRLHRYHADDFKEVRNKIKR